MSEHGGSFFSAHLDNLMSRDLNLATGSYILDLGAHRGEFLIECAKKGLKAVGVEKNPKNVEQARINARKENLEIEIIQAEGEKLPFDDCLFDFVNCSEVVEHVKTPVQILGEIFRVLKPGGTAYVSVHNRFGFRDSHFKLYGLNWLPRILGEKYVSLRNKQKDYSMAVDYQKISEMHYYTYTNFRKMAGKSGFAVRDIREEKMREKFPRFLLPLYLLGRIIYFNTFHIILKKPDVL